MLADIFHINAAGDINNTENLSDTTTTATYMYKQI